MSERSAPGGAGRSAERRSRRNRILVIDDEPMMGTTLRVMLRDDYEVEVVSSAREAQQRLEDEADEFDAVLCDLMLPGMSGMELHDWVIARRPALARAMLFMTGGAYTPEASKFLSEIGDRRVDKPFGLEELRAAVDRVLARTG